MVLINNVPAVLAQEAIIEPPPLEPLIEPQLDPPSDPVPDPQSDPQLDVQSDTPPAEKPPEQPVENQTIDIPPASIDPVAQPETPPIIEPPASQISEIITNELIINEVMAGSEINPIKDVWIELYNPTDQEIPLEGWQIKGVTEGDSWINITTESGRAVQPKDYFLISHYTNSRSSALAIQPQIQKTSLLFPTNTINIELKAPNEELSDKILIEHVPSDEFRSYERLLPPGDGQNPNQWSQSTASVNLKPSLTKTFATPKSQNSIEGSIGDVANFRYEWIEDGLTLKWTNPATENLVALNLYQINADESGWDLLDTFIPISTEGENHDPRLAGIKAFKLTTIDLLGRESQGEELWMRPKPQIFINEILPAPKTRPNENEFIELINLSNEPVDLRGWEIDSGNLDDDLSYILNNEEKDYRIQPNGFLVLNQFETGLTLANLGDSVYFFDPDGNEVDHYDFAPDLIGRSWGRIPEKPEEWMAYNHPTPGTPNIELNHPSLPIIDVQGGTSHMTVNLTAENSFDPDGDALNFIWMFEPAVSDNRENPTAYTYSTAGEKVITLTIVDEFGLSAIATYKFTATPQGGGRNSSIAISYPSYQLINEIMPSPVGKDTEGEWIELWNNTPNMIDLGSWYLDDSEGKSSPYKIPPGTIINPDSFWTIRAPEMDLSLKNNTDEVRLLDPNKEVKETIQYSEAKEGWSFAKGPDGSFQWTDRPTQGIENRFPEPLRPFNWGDVVIESVLPNPNGEDGDNEKLTLKNNLSEKFSLKGWSITNQKGKMAFLDTYSITADGRVLVRPSDIGLTLTNKADSLLLIDPLGNTIDQIEWEESASGQTIFRPDFLENGIEAQVSSVVDGDTFKAVVAGLPVTIRLIGVDTPETVHPFKVVQFYGKEASDYTKSRLTGKTVTLEFEPRKTDKYNRLLAYVYLEGALFNVDLIQKGYGFAYKFFPHRYFNNFEQYERGAKENKVGLWADSRMEKIIEVIQSATEEEWDEKDAENNVLLVKQELIENKENIDLISEQAMETQGLIGGLVIESILPNSEKGKTVEYARLTNPTNQTIELKGWSLDDIINGGSKPFVIRGGSIAPGAYRTFRKVETRISLNNQNDCATLINPLGETIDQICYGKTHKSEIFTHAGGNWKKAPRKTVVRHKAQQKPKITKQDIALSLTTESIEGTIQSINPEGEFMVIKTLKGAMQISYDGSTINGEGIQKMIDPEKSMIFNIRATASGKKLISLRPIDSPSSAKSAEGFTAELGILITLLISLISISVYKRFYLKP